MFLSIVIGFRYIFLLTSYKKIFRIFFLSNFIYLFIILFDFFFLEWKCSVLPGALYAHEQNYIKDTTKLKQQQASVFCIASKCFHIRIERYRVYSRKKTVKIINEYIRSTNEIWVLCVYGYEYITRTSIHTHIIITHHLYNLLHVAYTTHTNPYVHVQCIYTKSNSKIK